MDAATSHIKVEGVTMQFDTGSARMTALDDVSLDIKSGEFVSFLGPSGCGKSTLFMIIAGLLRPTQGRVSISGRQVTQPVTDIGIAFQQDLLVDWRTVLGNVMLQADVRKLDRTKSLARARELLKLVGLEGFEDKRPWQLSGGMRQRAAICRALLHESQILMMDEPFGALDAMTRDQMNLDLQDIWAKSNRTAVLVTHSIAEAVFLSDRVILMSPRPGRVALDLRIDLPRPRGIEVKETPKFIEYQRQLRSLIGDH